MTWDGEDKLLSFDGRIGAVLYSIGWPASEPMTALVLETETRLPSPRALVSEYAQALSDVLVRRRAARVSPFAVYAIVAGYDADATEGRVFAVEVPERPEPVEHHAGTFGITWGGMREFIDRLLQGYDNRVVVEDKDVRAELQTAFPLATMSLQEAVDLARFLIRTSVDAQRFIGRLGLQGAGGPTNAATITAQDGLCRVLDVQQRAPMSALPVRRRCDTGARPTIVLDVPEDIVRLASYTARASLSAE